MTSPSIARPSQPLHRFVVTKALSKLAIWSSALGQKFGWEWMTYNPLVIFMFERLALRNAPKMADAVLEVWPSLRSLVDIGCGGGGYVAELQRRGLRVSGCEYGQSGRKRAKKKGVDVHSFDLSTNPSPLPGCPFDAAMSIEVAEHVPASLATDFVKYLALHSDLIIFTAAPPGQGGHGHVNEQPPSYWVEKFHHLDFTVDEPATQRLAARLRQSNAADFLFLNLNVFRRKPRS